jgi:hypothetical protein
MGIMHRLSPPAPVAEVIKKFNPNHGPDGRFTSSGGGAKAVRNKHLAADAKMHAESGYEPTAGVMRQRSENMQRDSFLSNLRQVRDDAWVEGNSFGFRDNRDPKGYNESLNEAVKRVPGATVEGGFGKFVPNKADLDEAEASHPSYVEQLRNVVSTARGPSEARDAALARASESEDLAMGNAFQSVRDVDFARESARQREAASASAASARPAAGTALAPPKKPSYKTYAEAHSAYQSALIKEGWKDTGLKNKVQHITSPDGTTRLWFKAQAVYMTRDTNVYGAKHDFKNARSVTHGADLRTVPADKFVSWSKRIK